jgi:hypothetical protein
MHELNYNTYFLHIPISLNFYRLESQLVKKAVISRLFEFATPLCVFWIFQVIYACAKHRFFLSLWWEKISPGSFRMQGAVDSPSTLPDQVKAVKPNIFSLSGSTVTICLISSFYSSAKIVLLPGRQIEGLLIRKPVFRFAN